MRQLSAVDAIQPAWDHTRSLLLAPRRWGLVLKVGAVAFFAQMGFNFSFSSPGRHHIPGLPPVAASVFLLIAIAIGITALVIGLVLFYVSSRLQFVLFDIVLRRDTTVAPIWRRYGRVTWRWIGLKLLFFLVAVLCVAPIVVPLVIHYIRSIAGIQQNASHNFGAFFLSLLGFIAAIFFIALLIGIGYILLQDFGLPSMALEDTPLGETVARVWRLLRAQTGQVLFYVLMRFLLAIGGAIACELAIALGAAIALVPLGGAGFGLWLTLHHNGLGGHVAMIAGWVILGAVLLALIVVAAIMLLGYLFTFLQAYALYFLGGRYPLLGDLLEQSMPPPTAYMPPAGYPPYYPPPEGYPPPSEAS